MTVRIVHKNSTRSAANPTANQLAGGELAINFHEDGPFLSVRDRNNRIVRVGGIWLNDNAPPNPTHCALWVDRDNNRLFLWDDDTNSWRQLSGIGAGGGGGGGAVDSVTSGNGIDHQPAPGTGNVVISADIDTNRGLEFQGGSIAVNLGAGLQFDGTGQIELVADALQFVGAVDVTDETTRPNTANVGDVFINTGDGNVDADWADRLGNATVATDADPGDMVICAVAATAQDNGTYVFVATGGNVNVDLDYTQAADQGTITNTAGDDAVIPFADENFAGLFIEPDNDTVDTTSDFVRRSVNTAGAQVFSWVVASITPGDGLQNGDGTQNPIVAGGTIAVDLEAAGADTGGLAIDNGELRVDAGNGIELTAGGVAADLGAGLNFDAGGQIQIDVDNNPAPDNDGAAGHWTRANATSTLSPRAANDNLNQGSGTITTTGAVTGGSFTASTGNVTLSTAGADIVLTGTDNNPTNRTISLQAPTGVAGWAGGTTYTLPATPVNGNILSTNAAGELSWVAQAGGGFWTQAAGALRPTTFGDNVEIRTAAAGNAVNIALNSDGTSDFNGDMVIGAAPGTAGNSGLEFRPSGRFQSRVDGVGGASVGINNGNIALWIGQNNALTAADREFDISRFGRSRQNVRTMSDVGAWDLEQGNFWETNPANGSNTIATPTNLVVGMSGLIFTRQEITTFANVFRWPGGAEPASIPALSVVPFLVLELAPGPPQTFRILMGRATENIN